MATIDTSTIAGYADMTAEEKVAALEAHNIPDPKDSGWIEKSKFDKLSSDYAAPARLLPRMRRRSPRWNRQSSS